MQRHNQWVLTDTLSKCSNTVRQYKRLRLIHITKKNRFECLATRVLETQFTKHALKGVTIHSNAFNSIIESQKSHNDISI